ncbi:MAG: peptide chain release factor N(5)-glutamine methyltransferase [Verrucomicrobia bacterium]|nr:peptide chain release factor N(5)-glutamine methyltransferase [Verrucomicrobiota bacterium]
MKTVLEVITATTAFFQKSGVESPRLNIEHLLAHVLKKKRMDIYMEFDRALTEAELAPLRELVRRRAQREPLQHLLGTVEFLGLTLKTDARALIPRPETEQLCEMLASADCAWKGGRIADVGTGSGCIALALALALPDARVTGLDAADNALALARENADRCGLTARVTFAKSDLLSAAEAPFDLIVANLPYIPTGELAALQPEVQRDPRAALDGGADGLDLIRRLLPQAAAKLRSGGTLALEVGLDQSVILSSEFPAHGFGDARILKDLQGRERFIITVLK